MLLINRIRWAVMLAIAMLCAAAPAAHSKALKVNLIMDGGTIMIYAGANDEVKTGDVYSVMRADREIGKVEVTRVEATYAVAKVVSQTEEIREMDLLIKPVSVADSKKSGDKVDAKKSDPKADTKKDDDKKADDKKADDKKTSSKKKSSDKDDEKKDETKSSAKKKASKDEDKKDEDKKDDENKDEKKSDKDSGKDEKKDDAKAAAAPGAPAKQKPANRFPSMSGALGLFQMPTAFVASTGGGGLSLYMYKDNRSATGAQYGGVEGLALSYSNSQSLDAKSLALSYSFNENIEVSAAQIQMDISSSLDAANYFETVQASGSSDIKTTVIGVKFNPHKKYMLQPTTHKEFQYAFGVLNYSSNGDGDDLTRYYAVVSAPGSKLTFHGMVYYASASGVGSRKWGSMAGIEAPIADNALFIGDMDQFRGEETYTLGLRYLLGGNAALSVAVHDITDTHNTMLSGSFNF